MHSQHTKKILVVGANSFIANELIHELKTKADITGLYHSNTDKLFTDVNNIPNDRINTLDADFDDVYILSAFIPGKDINNSQRLNMFETNVALINTICNKFQNSRIIYASSVAVYKAQNDVITENNDEGGLNEYGVSKLWGEKIVQQVNSYAIVRFSSVYGPGMKLTTIIPVYIQQALQNKIINVWGNGARMQNYIHVSDAVNFLQRASASKINAVFLATSGQSISNRQLAEIISSATGADIAFAGNDAAQSFYYNNAFTSGSLNYVASVTFRKGIEEMIVWLKEKY